MRDSFLKLLRGERPDRVVWTGDLTYWTGAHCDAGDGDPRWQAEAGHLQLCQDLGMMPYFWYGESGVAKPVYDGVEMSRHTRGRRRETRWKTSVGELSQQAVFVDGSWSEAPARYAVNGADDLKVLLHILEHRRLEPTGLEAYWARWDRWAPYDGVPLLCMPRSPLPALFTEWAGVVNTVYLMADCPELVGEVLDLMEQQEAPIVDAVCELAPPVIHFPDNLSSENLTSFFSSEMAGRYRRRLEELHAANVSCAVHLDGTVGGLLPRLAAVGFDAVEALTPHPVGDVSVQAMRQTAGSDDVILWGGVPGAMFAPPFTWDDMQQHVEALLQSWAGEPFVVGTADQVPPNGDLEMCRKISAMLSTVTP